MKRREFIALAGAATLLGAAGCERPGGGAGPIALASCTFATAKERRIILRCLRSCDAPVLSRAKT